MRHGAGSYHNWGGSFGSGSGSIWNASVSLFLHVCVCV